MAIENANFVIDLTTGTIVGTNLVFVHSIHDEGLMEGICSNDSTAIAYGELHGIPFSQVEGGTDNGFVIDLETGTVLGLNLVAIAEDPEDDEVYESDSAAIAFGEEFGVPLFVRG